MNRVLIFSLILMIVLVGCGNELDLDEIESFSYSVSNLNFGGKLDTNFFKEEGEVFIVEDDMSTIFHYPLKKTFKAPEDFFSKLSTLLKDNKLNRNIKDKSEPRDGGPHYTYKISTGNEDFIIFEGTVIPGEYEEAFRVLDNFIDEVKNNSEIIEEEDVEKINTEDIIGFEFNFHGSDVLLRKEEGDNTGFVDGYSLIPEDILIDEAIDLLLTIPNMDEIKMYSDDKHHDKLTVNLNLFIKDGDTYKLLTKYKGDYPPRDLIEIYGKIYKLAVDKVGSDQ